MRKKKCLAFVSSAGALNFGWLSRICYHHCCSFCCGSFSGFRLLFFLVLALVLAWFRCRSTWLSHALLIFCQLVCSRCWISMLLCLALQQSHFTFFHIDVENCPNHRNSSCITSSSRFTLSQRQVWARAFFFSFSVSEFSTFTIWFING